LEAIKCIAKSGTPADVRQALRNAVDWSLIQRLAYEHRITPLLCHIIKNHCADLVPTEIMERLNRRININRFHNQLLTKELGEIIKLFDSNGIQGIPYKGPALATCAYGDLALRQFVDLDIIVPKADVVNAKSLLISRGYRLRHHLGISAERQYLKQDYEYRFGRDDRPTIIGLHWALAPHFYYFPFETLKLWDRATRTEIAGHMLLSLLPEDLLLLLCVHGMKERWAKLAWISDIGALLCRHPSLNWQDLLSKASALHAVRVLLVGLGLVHFLLEFQLPANIIERVKGDHLAMSLITSICATINCAGEYQDTAIEEVYLTYLLSRERLRDRLRMYPALMYLRRWLPPRKINEALWQFPHSLSLMQLVLYPFHLFGKCVTSGILKIQSSFREVTENHRLRHRGHGR
jgi:hypothetical protein